MHLTTSAAPTGPSDHPEERTPWRPNAERLRAEIEAHSPERDPRMKHNRIDPRAEEQRTPALPRVDEWMTRPAVTIHRSTTVEAARKLMKSRRIRHLPVVDDQDQLVGMVTDRDLRQVVLDPAVHERVAELAETLGRLTVERVMTVAVVTVRPETSITDAGRLMHERKIGALPVIDGLRVIGILSEEDVFRALLDLLGQPLGGSLRALWHGRWPRPYAGGVPEGLTG
jgi:CBS domain-containing protein